MASKDLVGPKNSAINKMVWVYTIGDLPNATGTVASIKIKEAAYSDALLTALGFTKTRPTGKRIIEETRKEMIRDWGYVPLKLKCKNDDTTTAGRVEYTMARVIADPGYLESDILAAKYHTTLDITKVLPDRP